MIPLRPGDLVGILGRPGMGKSSLLAYFARAEAKRILAREAGEREAVVYVTWETQREELENFFQANDGLSASDVAWGRADLEEVQRRAAKRASLPIWVIGHGIMRVTKRLPRMTPDAVLSAIESMRDDFGVRPTLLLFDYVQLIPIERAVDRVTQVTEVPVRIKEVALRVGAPAIIGIQAGREVDKRTNKIPEMGDCQWGSSIEQVLDKLFAVWRPFLTEPNGAAIELDGKRFTVNERLLILRLLKQRWERGRWTWGLHFAPEYLQLAELEMHNENGGNND